MCHSSPPCAYPTRGESNSTVGTCTVSNMVSPLRVCRSWFCLAGCEAKSQTLPMQRSTLQPTEEMPAAVNPQEAHWQNGKPPGLEEPQPNNALPCGKPRPPIERTEAIKEQQAFQSWILRSHFHQGRKRWTDCHSYYQANQPTVAELDGDIKVKSESIDKVLDRWKLCPHQKEMWFRWYRELGTLKAPLLGQRRNRAV